MAVITPQTEIRLVKCPLELSDLNQLTFASKTAQYNYFNGLPHVTTDNATYQRKDGYIRYPAQYDEIIQYNYVMYQNEAYSNKWFYAYIDKMEYISDGMTAVHISTDCFQTWQFDLTYKRTFVEREHTNDDTIGANTVPEGLERGEYVTNGTITEQILAKCANLNYRIVAALSDLSPINNSIPTGFTNTPIYGGVSSGLTYVVCETEVALNGLVGVYDSATKADAIYSVFITPKTLIPDLEISWSAGTTDRLGFLAPSFTSTTIGSFSLARPTTINGYIPVNNKLKVYPYNYCYITNNTGAEVELHYEDFTGGTASFTSVGVINSGCSIKAYPTNYKGQTSYYNAGIMGPKLPVCSWNSDSYTNWLTQNSMNIAMQNISNIGKLAMLPAGGIGAAMAGLSLFESVTQVESERYQASLMPDQARGNTNGSDINYGFEKCGFQIIPMSIKAEYARIIDDYFSMYGYKTNRVKVPNVTGRTNWNFVKTIGCYIAGDIPQEDMAKIKEMFDAGVTFWHNPITFMDYSQTNAIVV